MTRSTQARSASRGRRPRLPGPARIREVAALSPILTPAKLRSWLEELRRAGGDPAAALSILEEKIRSKLPHPRNTPERR